MIDPKKYYDDFYKEHGSMVHDDPVRFSKIASLCRGKVLDIGCGTGTLADFYSGDYTGVDISETAIEMAKKFRRKDARFIINDSDSFFDVAQPNFDTIVMGQFLEHIEDDKKLFQNILKSLSPQGRIIISVPNGDRVPDKGHLRQFVVPELRARFSQIGRVRFYNYPGFTERILLTIDIGEKSPELISPAIIAKNEAKGLEFAILSCIDFCDKIAIGVDSASTDDTLKIAERYADVVKVFKWENSFCKARNLIQEEITTKWALIIDGHEYVKSYPNIEEELKGDFDGLETMVLLENGFQYHFPRIIRKHVRWIADVHNTPVLKSRKLYDGFLVVHDRENLQSKTSVEIRNKQRNEMVISIMSEEAERKPKSPRPYFYLGQQYFIQKDFKRAIQKYHKYLKYSKHKGERWLACYEIAHAHVFLNHYVRALLALRDAEKEIPGRWEVYKLRGLILMMTGRFKKAIESFVESFIINTGKFTYYPELRDDAKTWFLIGDCLYRLKKYREAKVAWERFLELEKKKPEKERSHIELGILKRMITF